MRRGAILTKDNVTKSNQQAIQIDFFLIMVRQLNIYLYYYHLL